MAAPPIERRRRGPGPRLSMAGAICGAKVIDASGETLATISDVVLDATRGRIAYAVLGIGGFMGVGERLIAVPWSALQFDLARDCFVLADRRALDGAPPFDKQRWPGLADARWHSEMHSHWKSRPYWD